MHHKLRKAGRWLIRAAEVCSVSPSKPVVMLPPMPLLPQKKNLP